MLDSCYQPAFAFVAPPSSRSVHKPRRTGLSSMLDYGITLGTQRDLLETSGHLIDIAKIATGTARVYDKRLLQRKLDTYRSAEVKTYMGGQFVEYVFAAQGMDGANRLFAEAKACGFEIVEVSDTCRPLSLDVRRRLVGAARDHGLDVACEVGQLAGGGDPETLLSDAVGLLELDIDHLVVEGAELVAEEGVKTQLIETLRHRLDLTKLIFELPVLSVGACGTPQTEAMKRALIQAIGPDVNLGNLGPEEILETEVVRLGIEDWTGWPR